MPGDRLSPDEDQELRRLHWFETLGCELSAAMRTLKDNIRSRDRRTSIREPGVPYDRAAADAERTSNKNGKSFWTS
jgi:hypothetical protein